MSWFAVAAVVIQPAVLARFSQLCLNVLQWQAGALSKVCDRHAVDQPKCVQHVLERQFGRADHFGATDVRGLAAAVM